MAAGRPSPGDDSLNNQREPLPTRVDALPALPPTYLDALAVTLDALGESGVDVGEAAQLALAAHVRLMLAWNDAINLTAITDPVQIVRRHIADSLAPLPVLREGFIERLIDIGSGAGYPGLPIAAVEPWQVTLVESIGKKAAFLRAAVSAMDLDHRVHIGNARAETIEPASADVVTARAVGSLADLVEVGLPLLRPGGRLVAWKRGELGAELAAAGRAAEALGGSAPRWHPHPEAIARAADLAGHGVIVVVSVDRPPAGFPRDPATRQRRPW